MLPPEIIDAIGFLTPDWGASMSVGSLAPDARQKSESLQELDRSEPGSGGAPVGTGDDSHGALVTVWDVGWQATQVVSCQADGIGAYRAKTGSALTTPF
jgi:hypothetical protein